MNFSFPSYDPDKRRLKLRRKHARTQIYRALYGEGGKNYNIPWMDTDRHLEQGWRPALAQTTFDTFVEDAKFNSETLLRLRARLNQLAEAK